MKKGNLIIASHYKILLSLVVGKSSTKNNNEKIFCDILLIFESSSKLLHRYYISFLVGSSSTDDYLLSFIIPIRSFEKRFKDFFIIEIQNDILFYVKI